MLLLRSWLGPNFVAFLRKICCLPEERNLRNLSNLRILNRIPGEISANTYRFAISHGLKSCQG
jgi:hypothetical protein